MNRRILYIVIVVFVLVVGIFVLRPMLTAPKAGAKPAATTVAKPGALLFDECRLQQAQLEPHCLQWQLLCCPPPVVPTIGATMAQQNTTSNAMVTERRILDRKYTGKPKRYRRKDADAC